MCFTLLRAVIHLDGFQQPPGKARHAIPARRQFGFKAADHDGVQLFAVNLDPPGETLVVQQFQERGKALGVAVMGRRREKQLVLKVRREAAQGKGSLRVRGVLSLPGWSDVMGLVDNEQVKFARVGRLATGWQHFAEEAQRTLALEEVNRGDETRKVCPGIDVQPPLAAQVFQKRAIDDAKFQAELVAHLVAPLHLQRGRADNQYLARTMTYDKLLADQARLNGLTQADIIGNQQVGTRHLDGPHDRVKLVIFHLNATAKGGLQGLDISTGNGSPAYRVEKGIQSLRSIKANGNRERIP